MHKDNMSAPHHLEDKMEKSEQLMDTDRSHKMASRFLLYPFLLLGHLGVEHKVAGEHLWVSGSLGEM